MQSLLSKKKKKKADVFFFLFFSTALFVSNWDPHRVESITLPVGRTEQKGIRFSRISDNTLHSAGTSDSSDAACLIVSFMSSFAAFDASSEATVEVRRWRADHGGGGRLRCDAFLPRWRTGALEGGCFLGTPGCLLYVTQRCKKRKRRKKVLVVIVCQEQLASWQESFTVGLSGGAGSPWGQF